MSFFRNFPIVNYNFGSETFNTAFQNLTAYIDLIDQVADDASYYQKYYIKDNTRPDVLSYELYGTTEFYWMFYLLNEKLRVQGWPLNSSDVFSYAQEAYPNITILTQEPMWGEFYVGDIIADRTDDDEFGSTYKARILEKNYDLGQIIVKPIVDVKSITIVNGGTGYTSTPKVTISGGGGTGATAQAVMSFLDPQGNPQISQTIQSIAILNGGEGYTRAPDIIISEPDVPSGTQATATSDISATRIPQSTTIYSQKNQPDVKLWDEETVRSLITSSQELQYNSPHHYEDADGNIVDLDITLNGGVENGVVPGKTAISHLTRLENINEDLRKIKIFKPNVASQINAEYQKLLRN